MNENIVTMIGFVQIKSPSVTKPFYFCDERVAEAVRRWAMGDGRWAMGPPMGRWGDGAMGDARMNMMAPSKGRRFHRFKRFRPLPHQNAGCFQCFRRFRPLPHQNAGCFSILGFASPFPIKMPPVLTVLGVFGPLSGLNFKWPAVFTVLNVVSPFCI